MIKSRFNELFVKAPIVFEDITTGKFLWEPGDPAPVPRWAKPKDEKKDRKKKMGEVFTPSFIIRQMTGYLAEQEDVYADPDKTFIEITCGEAPFITCRYESETGKSIPEHERFGVLDRKLRFIRDTGGDDDVYIRALKSVYGYEYQTDSLLLARLNVLETVLEFVSEDRLEECAAIIANNFFRMDGLTKTIPGTDISPMVTNWRTGERYPFDKIDEDAT